MSTSTDRIQRVWEYYCETCGFTQIDNTQAESSYIRRVHRKTHKGVV